MKLYQEYFLRHNIDGMVVEHNNQGALILRTKDSWLLVTIKWQDNGIHPGKYIVEYLSPIHNGYANRRLFQKYNVKELSWDEYEDYFLSWSDSMMVPDVISGDKKVVLTAWEMFVYCYDGWLAQQSSELRWYVYSCLDTDQSVETRYSGYQNCLLYLTAKDPDVLKVWKYEVLSLTQHYSEWLAALVKKQILQ